MAQHHISNDRTFNYTKKLTFYVLYLHFKIWWVSNCYYIRNTDDRYAV